MTIFQKKPSAADLPLPERCKALRQVIYDAMQEHGVTGLNAARLLEDIAKAERQRIALTAPLPGATPRVTCANIEPSFVDNLRELIAGR